ncbi:hypothetical protein CCO03_10210 [Comamonas serinivorans]|uniref:Uncharacterized protein n=1 Tax=Comamonas serinivorans TaxID=1082851 RepID=A0A1Y0ENI4_9BURK|nr:hypothetical protein [Comamonas serinivorans]ARU05008.1 hypothetical protein CCO03_10210 [Comamonas serinivorans]
MARHWFQRKTAGASPPSSPPATVAGEANDASEAELLAQSMVKQLSSDILLALAPAQGQLQQLRQLSPTLTDRFQPVFAAVERAHDIARSAQLFSDVPQLTPAAEPLDAANFLRAAILGRGDWLRERDIQVRQALSSAQVQARPGELYTFFDELLLWTSDFSSNVALQLEAVYGDEPRPRTRLRVGAWFPSETQGGRNPKWQNTRWFVWHRIARRLQARTELRTDSDHLVLRVSFPPVQDATAAAAPTGHSQLHGLRVLLVSAHPDRRAAVLDALVPLGMHCEVAASVAAAAAQLAGQTLDAVIHDELQSPEAMMALRRAPAIRSSTAFIELHASGNPQDFQTSTVGAFSTGHVAADAIARTLVSVLSFELFKGIR